LFEVGALSNGCRITILFGLGLVIRAGIDDRSVYGGYHNGLDVDERHYRVGRYIRGGFGSETRDSVGWKEHPGLRRRRREHDERHNRYGAKNYVTTPEDAHGGSPSRLAMSYP
jgi:hypothetical protein